MKRVIRLFTYFLVLALLIISASAFNIIKFGLSARPEPSDCIIVLGCRVYGAVPSPFLIERLNEGLRLYNKGYGKFIIVSGGKGTGEDVAEADAMRDYLLSKGFDSSKIITEDKSASTMQNLLYSREKMKSYNLNTAVIVSNKYHLKRASLMARKLGIDASYSGVFVSTHESYEILGFLRETLALLKFYILQK